MDLLSQIFSTVVTSFTQLTSRLALLYLVITVLIVAVLWIIRGRPKTFVEYLLPKDIYLHRSNIVDIKIFLFNSALAGGGLFAAVTMTPVVTSVILNSLLVVTGGSTASVDMTLGKLAAATVIMILTLDFCKYWAHRLHHEASIGQFMHCTTLQKS